MSEESDSNKRMVKVIKKKKEIIDEKTYLKWLKKSHHEYVNEEDGDITHVYDKDVKEKNKYVNGVDIKKNKQENLKKKQDMKMKKDKKSIVYISTSEENDGEEETYDVDIPMLTYSEEDLKVKKRNKKMLSNSDFDSDISTSSDKEKVLKNRKPLSLNAYLQCLIRDARVAIQGEKLKKKCKGKMVKEECMSIRNRSSPKQLFSVVKDLNDDQKQAVRDIGFGSILELSFGQLPLRIGYFVVDRLDVRTLKIRLENSYIQIDKEVVHDMLGIPLGGENIKREKISKCDDKLTKEWRECIGMEKGNIRASHVVNAIKKSSNAGRNFILSFLVLFNTCMAETTTMGTCNLKFLPYIKDDMDIKKLDWCQYIIDCLKVSKYYWGREADDSYYTGPLSLLILAYVDSTKCNRLQVIRKRPALKSWTSEMLSNRENAEINSGGFGKGELKIPFELEQKMCLVKRIDEVKGNDIMNDQKRNTQQESLEFRSTNVQECIQSIESMFVHLKNEKGRLQSLLIESLLKYPDNQQLQYYDQQVKEFFGQTLNETSMVIFNDQMIMGEAVIVDVQPNVQDVTTNKVSSVEILDVQPDVQPVKMPSQKTNSSSETIYSDSFLKIIDDTVESILSKRNVEDFEELRISDSIGTKMRAKNGKDFEKQKADDIEGPSFSLNLTQEEDEEQEEVLCVTPLSTKNPGKGYKAIELEKEKRKVEKVPVIPPVVIDDVPEKKKRIGRPSKYVTSPYKEKVVDGSTNLEHVEKNVVFASSDGYMLIPDMIQTMLPGKWILITIIDIWSHMLNLDEKHSSKYPFRFFCSTICLREQLIEYGKLDDKDFKYFEDKILLNSKVTNDLMLFKNVDLVFFPVLVSSHYYLICFNLKRAAFLIIDNVSDEEPLTKRYQHAPNVMKDMFGRYLEKVGHAKAKAIMGTNPQRAKMKWRTTRNVIGCGVFAMCHMESYKAEQIKDWDCGLQKEGEKQQIQLNALRIKYATKILLSDINIHKEKVVEEMEKLSLMDQKEKEELIVKSAIKLLHGLVNIV